MAKLTKAQKSELRDALYHAKRACDYVYQENVVVSRRDTVATTTLHLTRKDGLILYPVQKEYGSDLCGLRDCIQRLEQFLVNHD